MRLRANVTSGLLLSAAMTACQSISGTPPTSTSPSPSSSTSCGASVENVGGYLFSGSLGIQNGIESRLQANQLPVKVLWANRSAQPPQRMTISGIAQASEVRLTAGWAATQTQQTFPTTGIVTGYVSEIPTLPFAGCWEFRWNEGSAGDRLTLRVAP